MSFTISGQALETFIAPPKTILRLPGPVSSVEDCSLHNISPSRDRCSNTPYAKSFSSAIDLQKCLTLRLGNMLESQEWQNPEERGTVVESRIPSKRERSLKKLVQKIYSTKQLYNNQHCNQQKQYQLSNLTYSRVTAMTV